MNYLYNEKKYQDIFNNYHNGNTEDYKKTLNKLDKWQIIYFNQFLYSHYCAILPDFNNREFKIISRIN